MIAATKRSAFSLKIKMATEWRLTEFCSDIDGAFATKDFMKWTQPKKQNTVPLVRPSVPLVRPYGPPGETVVAKLSRNGPSGETVEAKIQAAQSHHEDTYSLPGGKRRGFQMRTRGTSSSASDSTERVLNRSAAVVSVNRRCRLCFGRFATTLDFQLFQQYPTLCGPNSELDVGCNKA